MRRSLAVRIGSWLRWTAAGTALAAVLVLLAYRHLPGQIDRLDLAVEQWFVAGPRERLQEALRALADPHGDRGAARGTLLELHEDLASCRRGDRHFPVWRRATAALAEMASQDGDAAAAVAFAELAVAADGRDYEARLHLCRLQLAAPGWAEEGRRTLRALQALVPEQAEVAQLFAATFAGEPRAVGRALAAFARSRPEPLWILHYDGSDALDPRLDTAVLQPACTGDGRWLLPFRLPAGSRGVHLELPAGRWWGLVAARLRVGADGAWREPDGTSGLREGGGVLWTDGGRPRLDFALAAATSADEDCAFEVAATASLPPWLAVLLRGELAAQCIAVLEEPPPDLPRPPPEPGVPPVPPLHNGGTDAADAALLGRWRTAACMLQPSHLFWSGDGGPFTADRQLAASARLPVVAGDRTPFAVEFALPGGAARARFDPAVPPGGALRIDAFAVLDRGGGLLAELPPGQWLHRHQLAEDGGPRRLRASGGDPHFSVELPEGAARVRIEGVLP